MKGEKVFFRKKLFGGFNREDVVVYIAQIAEERNEAITAKEKAENEVSKLTREIQILRGELPSAPEPKTEPTVKPEDASAAAPEEALDDIPEPSLEMLFVQPTDLGDKSIKMNEAEFIQPVDFGYAEETVTVEAPDPEIEEKTETPESPVVSDEEKKAPTRVKIVKRVNRNK